MVFERKTIFVAGLGMVGIAFIEKLLNLDEQCRYEVITCGEEAHLAYNRVALTEYFQHRSVEKLYLNSPEWYRQQDPSRFVFYTGEKVISIDPEAKVATTDNDKRIFYDYCVIATGSNAALPPYIRPERAQRIRGVFVYRNLSDLDDLIAYSQTEGVKGGGLLGLEAAKAVYDLPDIKDVCIVNRQAYPLSRQLDADAGELVLHRIEALGVKVFTNAAVKEILTIPAPKGDAELDDGKEDLFTGIEFNDGTVLDCQLIIFAIAGEASGITCHPKGGISIGDNLMTSAQDVYAIGECANWRGHTYGLIGPGVEMADILSFNLTQTQTELGSFKARKMNDPDLSTKLKLMGVDVASFGDFFADKRSKERIAAETAATTHAARLKAAAETQSHCIGSVKANGEVEKRRQRAFEERLDEPIKCLTYKDPFASVYKKYIFSADGKHLLGGMMIGDVSDYVKLVGIVKKKKPLEVSPSEFIVGRPKNGEDDGGDLDDDTQVCSCHNVTKADIIGAVKGGIGNIGDLKAKTKAGTGCGGCIPLVTNIFKAELKKAGVETNNNVCQHFNMSRAELFNVIKIKQLKDFPTVMSTLGMNKNAIGCELCKPAVGSILSSLYNEHIIKPIHNQNQDTNDKYLANIQRNGTFSVVPRISGGEITPDGLIVIGQVAKKYGLYTKITGGQRIDMFGAQKQDLPSIWSELVEAGFQSGHAYGKSLRTVKSCVGTTWCRYGVGDSVGLAVQLEERYKSIRAPHKIKGGVSGCVRECAEAQSKDFGLIATDKGWNLFIAGNGGANPRHATLFATDVPPSRVVRLIDRFLMYYIRTADKLQRTARWVENYEGGIERLKKVLIDDELGICGDLEREMDALIGTYECEWTEVVRNPERQKIFRQFVNTDETRLGIETIVEREQKRPADWPKEFPGVHITENDIGVARADWKWRPLAQVSDLAPSDDHSTSATVKYGDSQLAIFHVPKRGYYATQQMCPHKRAFVLDHGLVGDDSNGNVYVSCPLHKRNFNLSSGECLNDTNFGILAFDVVEEDGLLLVKLPEENELDQAIGTSKWMVRNATAEAFGRGGGTQIEIVGPDGRIKEGHQSTSSCSTGGATAGCGNHGNSSLEW
ncbi:nitrite reductase [Cantharellus anzutake]|uniref:nitrite reductase n=1 Tax=Cantharellus anzutake TaxID=1750568 RepID=UPI001902FD62|nr:nitrite reductase [Cantharellus anzutake]KAF8327136.1 nitrite reductase [Cantharellus anzutake]